MNCRANLLASVALALALGAFTVPALAGSGLEPSAIDVPALSPAEQEHAYAPASPQTEPAAASPRGERAALSADPQPDPGPVSTSSLAPAPVGDVPVPLPALAQEPSAAASPAHAADPALASTMPAAPSGPEPGPMPAVQQPAPAVQSTPPAAAAEPVETPPSVRAPQDAAAVAASLAARLEDLVARHGQDAQAISDFYGLRNHAPLWVVDGALTPVAKALVERMSRAGDDGLDAAAFHVGGLDILASAGADGQAQTEVAIASAILTYIRQASSGRVDTRQIGRDIVPAVNMPEAVAALASVAIAADPVAVLEGYNPVAPQYLALKRKLAEVRAANAATARTAPPLVPPGPTLRVGMSDTRVAVLRTRLGLTASDGDGAVYDEALQKAVRDFQAQRNLKASGTLGPATVAALNSALRTPRINIESEIVANMERWRWLPHDMGDSYVLVNVPEYKVRVIRNGVPVLESKVVVGKPNTPTPLFSDTMDFVVMNPSWNVPQSIIKKEYLPKLAEDPDYLARHGFVVTYRDGQMQVRQPPGEDNALGHIKFMFPNNFSVYLHDTSTRSLFAKDKRAFSHGCVRVDNPYNFAETVMGAENGWTANRVESMVGGREQRIDLKQKIPVHIAYFTAYVDEGGELKLVDDLYGYDQKVVSALGLRG
ncbi:L,D-transpeptidase family protein [Labrys monachus]|uniref:Murein L,D-transpeptidase YcbB/YkuD n=1 Tax=Labrys monachus TaxID=217067 RepID=A0ABU0FQZ7_9HYPH|nr:L,D-transpeptidase family protein [Labrys monachus]MDQ0396483.1 murein L,D-transpeptidase YcbB/YkuD [Labrys monachus]